MRASRKVQRCHRLTARNDETTSAFKFPERHRAAFNRDFLQSLFKGERLLRAKLVSCRTWPFVGI